MSSISSCKECNRKELFSLGNLATTINLSVGGKRLSFDPQFRFDLDGMRPWSFLFIWHYKLIKKENLDQFDELF